MPKRIKDVTRAGGEAIKHFFYKILFRLRLYSRMSMNSFQLFRKKLKDA